MEIKKTTYQVILCISLLIIFPVKSSAIFEVVPENPIEGQNIQLHYVGCAPVVPNIATNELYYLEQEGNLINFIGSYGYGLPTCPIVHEHYYDIGILPKGEYQLDIYRVLGTTPFPINTDEGDPGVSLTFGVSAPIQIPFASWPTLFILMSLLILTVQFRLYKQGKI